MAKTQYDELEAPLEMRSAHQKPKTRRIVGFTGLIVGLAVFALVVGAAILSDDQSAADLPSRRRLLQGNHGNHWWDFLTTRFFGDRLMAGLPQDDGTLTAHRASILHFVGNPLEKGGDEETQLKADDDAAEYFSDGLLVLTPDGHVEKVGDYDEVMAWSEATGMRLEIIDQRPNLIMPGWIDAHVHYSQETMTGSWGESLLWWLSRDVYPTEALFGRSCGYPFDDGAGPTSDECSSERLKYARYMSKQFVDDLLRVGTTTAAVFTTVFEESTEALFEEAEKQNMRLIAGVVGQDRQKFSVFDLTQTGLYDTAERFYENSKALIEKWHEKPGARTLYAITPRFAPSSTELQMELAGRLVQEHPTVYVQSHLSENFDEVALVINTYSNHTNGNRQGQLMSYPEVYDHFGLMTDKTLFGHSIHLSASDWELLSRRGASVVHCPSSNLFLGSGLFNLAMANRTGVKVGIGSDVGAGTQLSTLTTLDNAYKVASLARTWLTSMMPKGDFPNGGYVQIFDTDVASPSAAARHEGATRMRAPENGVPPNDISLSAAKAFYLATLGSAKALSLEHKIGNFEKSKEADFIVLDLSAHALTGRRFAYTGYNAESQGSWWSRKPSVMGGKTPSTAAINKEHLWQKLFALMTMGGGKDVKRTYLMGQLKHESL